MTRRNGVFRVVGGRLDATGTQGGLVVHPDCYGDRLTAVLRVADGFLVHGLDRAADDIAVAQGTTTFRQLGVTK